MNKIRIINGNMLEVLPTLPPNSCAASVQDPPYELNFMNKGWDNSGIAFQKETWEAVERVLYPGGFLLAFGGTRTAHRMAVAIEDAGFTINNFIGWTYFSGFPKATDITKKMKSEDKKEWSGWKTPQMKPSIEPCYIGQKALDTVDSNLKPLDPFPPFYSCSKVSTKERTMDGNVKCTHPTLKPKKLLGYLMRLVAPKGSTILDPFMGSGSGGLAAIDEGMSYIGIEKEEEYFGFAEQRIDAYFKKLKVTPKKTVGDKVIEWEY